MQVKVLDKISKSRMKYDHSHAMAFRLMISTIPEQSEVKLHIGLKNDSNNFVMKIRCCIRKIHQIDQYA